MTNTKRTMPEPHQSLSSLYLRWMAMIRSGDYSEAQQVTEEMQAVVASDDKCYAWCRWIAARNLAKLSESEERFETTTSANPRSETAWIERGESFLELDLFDRAVAGFEQVLDFNPDSDAAWWHLAVAKSEGDEKDEPETVLACFDRALTLNPACEEAWFYKGLYLGRLNRPEEAIVCFDWILTQLCPENKWAWQAKGLELAVLRRREEALQCYVHGLKLEPDRWPALACNAQQLEAEGRLAEASQVREHLLSLTPQRGD